MIPICHVNTHYDDISIVALLCFAPPLRHFVCCSDHCLHVTLAINAPERREGDETLLYCASQSCVMIDALVIFLPFQSGFNPQSWPRLTELDGPRLQVDGGP